MHPYDGRFFLEDRDSTQQSAEQVVPLAMEFLHPSSVVDVGCPLGTWLILREFADENLVRMGALVDPNPLHAAAVAAMLPFRAFVKRAPGPRHGCDMFSAATSPSSVSR